MNVKKLLCAAMIGAVLTTGTVSAHVSYEQIRNATGKLSYNGTTFLIDPLLAEKGRYEGFAGTFRSDVRNPCADLPASVGAILDGVDAVVVTHTHLDHWDDAAVESIPKDLPIFVQDDRDAAVIRNAGFQHVSVLTGSAVFGGVTLTYVEGTHGTQAMYDDPVLRESLGESMGVVFSAPGEKTVYLVGDTVWTPRVSKTLAAYKPDILIMNTGYAKALAYNESIIMGTADAGKAAAEAPDAKIIAVHMDAINHCTVSRRDMRDFIAAAQLEDQVLVPDDGETIDFT